MSKFIDLTGQKFGRLLVLGRAENSRTGITRFNCLCDCGNRSIVTGTQLRNGHTQSCGCLRKDLLTTHDATHSRLYTLWWGIKQRCLNPKSTGYKNYGGRGITVCDEWLSDFQAFSDWAYKNGYNDTLTIDRIDNNKGYSPDNCQWKNMKYQGNHRRNNNIIEYNGESHTVSEWGEILGIGTNAIFSRLLHGWTIEKIMETPIQCSCIELCYKGETGTLQYFSEKYSINKETLRDRIKRLGWSVEKAIETPIEIHKHKKSI